MVYAPITVGNMGLKLAKSLVKGFAAFCKLFFCVLFFGECHFTQKICTFTQGVLKFGKKYAIIFCRTRYFLFVKLLRY